MEKVGIVGGILSIVLVLAMFVGYVMNVYKLATSDFEQPYVNEGIRAVGVIAFPLGAIVGYVSIEDKQD